MADIFEEYKQNDPIELCKEYIDDVLQSLFPNLNSSELSPFGGNISYPDFKIEFDLPIGFALSKGSELCAGKSWGW